MSSIVCLRGLPGSGKSTFAKANLGTLSDYVRVNRDDLRQSLFDGFGILEPWQENLITKVQRASAAEALKAGKSVIVDDTNLRHKYLRAWNQFALEHGAGFNVHDVLTPVNVCVERDSARERSVGEKVIRDMAEKFTKPCTYNGYSFNPYYGLPEVKYEPYLNPSHLPHTVIVDIDGTMALMGDRNPYDESTVSQDKPNWPVVRLVQALISAGDRVIFLSGRTDGCFDDTAKWLNRFIPRDWANWTLLMRKSGDNRRDDIVKREIFDAEIRDKYHVKFVLDDRNQVVRMWRALGLPVFQVADGDF
jgi:predicted kinase